MSVTNPTPLPKIAFSKNPVWFYALSDDYLAAAAANAVNYIEFTAAIAADQSIIPGWNNGGATMTAKAVPDHSGLQFPTGDGGNAYVQSLVPYFQSNFFIDRDFVVSADITGPHPRLVFTANLPGPDYNFTGVTGMGIITPGISNLPVSNFQHHVEVWVAELYTGLYDQAFSANIPLDEPLTGYTSADIHEALHSFLTHDRPVTGAIYQQCINSIRKYYVKYAQIYGDIPAVKKVYRTATAVVTLGGLGMQHNLVRNIITELCPVGSDPTQNRFLRQGSKNKLVTTDQPEWLTWINFGDTDVSIALEVVIYNTDATSFTFNPVAALTIHPLEKYQFAVGYTQLNITGMQSLSKIPVYYTVRVKVGAGYYTATYAFVVDYNYREWPRYLVYENSYGAFQTIGTVGKGLAQYDRTKDDAHLAVNRNVAAMDGDFLECNIFIQDKFTVSIGYDRAGSRNTELLRELLLSHKIYIYEDGVLIPIGLNTKNLKDALDGTNVYANVLEYYPLYQQEVWTEDQAEVTDDALASVITQAGSPVPASVPPVISSAGTLVIEYNDTHLATVAGNQVYTNAYWLAGKTNYRIYATQLGQYFRTEDITYNSTAGSFTILVPGFVLMAGEQLIVWPFVLNP